MIIDTHTHFYDPSRPQGVPWPPEKSKLLYRTVLPEHFKAIAIPEGVSGTIVVEASEWVEDNAWILKLAADEPFIKGFVGNLEPGADGFEENLSRFDEDPLFVGIRMRGRVVESLSDPSVGADLEKLAARDLELDLLVRQKHLAATAALAQRMPELRIVINHVAGVRIDGNPPAPAWVDGMRSVAEHPNVYCKVSALATATRQRPAPTDVAFYGPTLDVLWDVFGEDRLIYGSDWPVCTQSATYPAAITVVKQYFQAKGERAAEKYFWENSKAVYKWAERA